MSLRTRRAPVCRPARRAAAALAALVLALPGPSTFAGTPTLRTITVDGNMADWASVLADPDNVYLDGPAGGLPDLDGPADPVLDLDTFAFTWDATNLYLYLHRQGSITSIRYYWFFFDVDNDGLMETGEPMLRLEWWGSNRRTALRRDTYTAALAAGDPLTNAGSHDGYTLPGANTNGPSLGNPTGGSANGLEAEAAVPWTRLGVPSGTGFGVHVSASKANSSLPSAAADNLGGRISYAGVLFNPDRAATTTPGTTAVFAHTVQNTGNATDRFELTWTSAGTFSPDAVTFYRDADGSGTLTPGDTLLADGDGDTLPDTGLVAAGATLSLLVAVATPAGEPVGDVATVSSRATSDLDGTVFDGVVDTVTLAGPALTVVKSADRAVAAPGETIAYMVTFTNTGNDPAQNVVVNDAVPSPTTYVAGSAAGAGAAVAFSHDGGATFDASEALPVTHIRWTLAAPLAPGASATVAFSVLVP